VHPPLGSGVRQPYPCTYSDGEKQEAWSGHMGVIEPVNRRFPDRYAVSL